MAALSLLVLRCKDIGACKRFYEGFGISFVTEKHGEGPEHFSAEDSGFIFELYPAAGGPADQTGLGFETHDLDGLHAQFRKNQFAPREIRETELGRMFILRDPDGRRIEVRQEPAHGDPTSPATEPAPINPP
jgi:catechol 2,3-dioxygenase-like lactoylglutathione lyase family enzyme